MSPIASVHRCRHLGIPYDSGVPSGGRLSVIPVRIASLSVDSASNSPVVLLRRVDDAGDFLGDDVLPIWIGHAEAMAILLGIQGAEPPRPLTHDLMRGMFETFGFYLERVEITRLEEGTFYAALVLRGEERRVVVDARPSDSMALAVRVGCPIVLAEEVWDEAAVVAHEGGADEEQEVERFREFLEHVDPSDFTGH
ncbi:MAG: hypothetical protein C0418_00160 [Coriobacteriaceae bacterium]|nr:hypothetical protein [Coriobacteriaceae bacterium]